MPFVEAKLLDADGRPVTAPDTPGILWVKMKSLCRGYWRQPDKTSAAFRDGWFRTGDVCVFDRDGWWSHQGRADDLLKISGQWVSPTEIEECATSVPGVSDAIAVGAPDADGLVRLALFLVAPNGGSDALQAQVQQKLLATLSKYKCPRRIMFIDAIPRTATGKARRFRLRQWISGDFLGRLMRALHLDPVEIERAAPALYGDMQRTCVGCENHDRCACDLDEGVSAANFQHYCPIAAAVNSLRAEAPAH
jgi:acyl-coenzyme A synthetase/AMP-(fatty) acid ligase